MNYKKIDFFLIPITFFCFLISTYLLVADQLSFKLNQAQSIGVISSKSNTVKTKLGESLFWSNVQNGLKLDKNAKVYTHKNSQAQIEINDGPKIDISENTLISLSQFMKNKEIIVSKGHIVAELNKKNKSIKVNIGSKIITLNSSNAKVQISSNQNVSTVSVIEGKVEITQNKQRFQVQSGQIISTNKKDKLIVENSAARLISPLYNEKLFSKKSSHRVSFKWRGKESGSIVISKDYNFKNIIYRINTSNFSHTTKLRPGQYFWKVVTKDKRSITQTFTIVPQVSTILTFPKEYEDILYKNDNPQIFFKWQDKYFKDFELSINGNIRIIKNSSYFSTNEFQEGAFTWKVRPSNSLNSSWSKDRSFTISRPKRPKVPKLIEPINKHEVIIFPKSKAIFRWSRSSASKFKFELSNEKNFNNILFQKISTSNSLKLEIKKSGKFYWRVKPIDDYGRKTTYSTPNSVDINIYSTTMLPSNGAKLIIDRPSKKVEFKWKDLRSKKNKNIKYIFEISRDDNFSKIDKSISVVTNYIETSFPVTGVFYWRTKVNIEGRKPYYGEPQRVTISPTPPPLKPILEDTFEIEMKVNYIIDKVKNLFSKVINFFIPSVSANNDTSTATLKWKKSPDTKQYFIEIYQDINLEKLVLKTKTKTNSYELINFKEGTYYWRISTLDYWNRKSEFSNLSRLILKLPSKVKKITKSNLLSPKDKAIFTGKKKEITFFWKKSPEANKYKIKVSKKSDFSSMYLMRTTKLNSFSIYLSHGAYFWKVTSINKYGREIDSSIFKFNIHTRKKPKLKIVKKLKTIKKVRKLKQASSKASNLFLRYDLAISSLKQQYSAYSISAKDLIFTSLELGTHYLLSSNAINLKIRRFSGKVFENESYGVLSIESNYQYEINSNFSASIGLSLSKFKAYKISGNEITALDERSLAIPLALYYRNTFENHRNTLSLNYSLGSLSKLSIIELFDINFKKDNYFSVGGGYESYSSKIDTSNFKISNILGFFRYNISY